MASVVAHAAAIAPAAAAPSARTAARSSSRAGGGLKAHRSAFASGASGSGKGFKLHTAAASRARAAASTPVDTTVTAAVVDAPEAAKVAWPDAGPVARGSGWEVHKFGGTCVGSAERISGCCDLLVANAKNGTKTFAVVSAMGVIDKSEPKARPHVIAPARSPFSQRNLSTLEG